MLKYIRSNDVVLLQLWSYELYGKYFRLPPFPSSFFESMPFSNFLSLEMYVPQCKSFPLISTNRRVKPWLQEAESNPVNANFISQNLSTVFPPLCQLYFLKSANYISLTLSIVFLKIWQLYFSHSVNCISWNLPTVFLSLCQSYFSKSDSCISHTFQLYFLKSSNCIFSDSLNMCFKNQKFPSHLHKSES